jgi:single-stranded DNA-binding protein 1
MARGYSKAIIMGNLTRDPELRNTPSGASVCTFTVAVNRNYKDSSGSLQEAVSFIDCVAWNKPGEIINQYAKKGTGIFVSGRLDQRSWEDKTTGSRRSRVEIVVEDFNFMSNTTKANGYSSDSQESAGDFSGEDIVPEDIDDTEINLQDVPF